MAIDFPSEEWTAAYKEAINSDPEYKTAGAKWTAGPLAFVVKAEPSVGLEEDTAFVLDVHQGECRDAYVAEMDKAKKQPFVITGSYAQWKSVIRGELDPIKGMMQGKLKLKGNLPMIVRFVQAAKVRVSNAAKVDTRFLDD